MKAEVKRYQEIFSIDQDNMDGSLREELILENAYLVYEIAERMAIRLPPNISKEELIGPGIMGLLDALDKFNSKKGIKFRTCAAPRIKGAILDELRKMDWVSRSVRKDIKRIEDAMRAFELRLGREPEDFEVAREMGVDIDSYYRMTARAHGAGLLSLDKVRPAGTTTMLANQISDEPSPFDKLKIKELKKIISKALSNLSEKEQQVISLYYFDELTLQEIAEILDLTESRISQIHSKIIIKLRARLKSYYKERL